MIPEMGSLWFDGKVICSVVGYQVSLDGIINLIIMSGIPQTKVSPKEMSGYLRATVHSTGWYAEKLDGTIVGKLPEEIPPSKLATILFKNEILVIFGKMQMPCLTNMPIGIYDNAAKIVSGLELLSEQKENIYSAINVYEKNGYKIQFIKK